MTEAQAELKATSCKCQYIPRIVVQGTSEGQTERPAALWELVLWGNSTHHAGT